MGTPYGFRHNVLKVYLAFLISLLFLLLGSPVTSNAQNYRVHASPNILIPVGEGDIYGIGGGASVVLTAEMARGFTPWAAVHLHSIPPAASELDASLFLSAVGGGLGLYHFPHPRLKISGSTGGGLYVGRFTLDEDAVPTGNLYWEVGAEIGYRVSPGLTISGKANFIDFRRQSDSLYRGLGVSLVVELGISSRQSEGRVILEEVESEPIYPILASNYKKNSFGSVTIKNAENAEIRNVEVRFSAGEYSSSSELCGEIDYLARNGEITFPLHASFSERIMNITEQLRTAGQIVVNYELLGEPRTSRAETTISFHDRNSFIWENPQILASFVSPNDQALLDFSKYVAGLIRSDTRPELDSNLQYALGLFEGLRLSNIAWSEDPQTPYSQMRRTPDKIDYVQYPHQTLSYRGGDSDDLAVLFAAAIESVGVPSAIAPLTEDVIVAVKLKAGKSAVQSFFTNPKDFLFVDDEVWIPVRMSMLREGFLRAWSEGARLVGQEENLEGKLFTLDEAWRNYPPAGVPEIRATAGKPQEEQVMRAFNSLVNLVVEREVSPKAERMREAFGSDGGTGRQRNALGVLYARYGVYEKALIEFQAAAEVGYDRAHINIGNIAFLLKDYETALTWYRRVEEEYPSNPTVLISLARTYYELDRFDEADSYFKQASQSRPEFAERFSYLAARVIGSVARASAAMDRLGDMLWEE